MMKSKKKVIGDPIIINGRQLSLSKAIKAGDFMADKKMLLIK